MVWSLRCPCMARRWFEQSCCSSIARLWNQEVICTLETKECFFDMFDIVQGVVYLGAVLTRDQLLYILLSCSFSWLSSARFEVGDRSKMGFTSVMLPWRGPFHQVRSVVTNLTPFILSPGLLLQFWCCFVAHVRLVNSCCRGISFASCDFLGKTFHNLVSAEWRLFCFLACWWQLT